MKQVEKRLVGLLNNLLGLPFFFKVGERNHVKKLSGKKL